MVKTIYSAEQMRDEFIRYGRGDKFSPAGFRGLWEYLEEVAGDDFALDVIGLCCDFTEYENIAEAVNEGGGYYENDDQGREWLSDRTTVIELDNGGVIIANY